MQVAARDATTVHHRGRIAAGVVVAWVLILGIIVGIGELITKDGHGNVLGDRDAPALVRRPPHADLDPPGA